MTGALAALELTDEPSVGADHRGHIFLRIAEHLAAASQAVTELPCEAPLCGGQVHDHHYLLLPISIIYPNGAELILIGNMAESKMQKIQVSIFLPLIPDKFEPCRRCHLDLQLQSIAILKAGTALSSSLDKALPYGHGPQLPDTNWFDEWIVLPATRKDEAAANLE